MSLCEIIRRVAGCRVPGAAGALIGFGLAWLICGGTTAAGPSSDGRKLFTNSIAPMPAAVSATLQELGATDLSQPMEVEIALQMRDFPRLLQRLGRREIIPRAELEQKYLPSAADYEKLVKWAKEQGLAVRDSGASRLAVFARGTVAQIQQAL
jgi:hypothetical protein